MRTRRFYQSLRFKMSLGLFLPLVAILSLLSYLQYANQQGLLMENLKQSATNAGDIVEGSLKQAMLRNDFSDVQQIVDDIAGQEGVLDLFLVDKQGLVVLSGGRQ
ncbi:MAG: cell wall metabolism sensor histidine kinase WalK, partial [Anaerolineae bacterium]|nr:cell wall metabolism sensor histidine kinase WalK [Anaerolineae bacterium]